MVFEPIPKTQFEAKIVVLGDQKMNTYTSNLIGWNPIKEDVGTIIEIVYLVKLITFFFALT